MPAKKQNSQGGGRKPNSEPRQQLFSQFSGCNFELSPRDFTLGKDVNQEQSDMQMNYVVVQNNAVIATNKTIETRNNLIQLFQAPRETEFTSTNIFIDNTFYAGLKNGDVAYGNIGGDLDGKIRLINHTTKNHTWRSFAYADNQLVATTQEDQLWTGPINGVDKYLENAVKVPDPSALTMSNLVAKGELQISATATDKCDKRVGLSYTYMNKFGPTKVSQQLSFYCNYTISEWHSGRYLQIKGTAPTGYGIVAVELYYTAHDDQGENFCGRTDIPGRDGGNWSFNWFGYLDAT